MISIVSNSYYGMPRGQIRMRSFEELRNSQRELTLASNFCRLIMCFAVTSVPLGNNKYDILLKVVNFTCQKGLSSFNVGNLLSRDCMKSNVREFEKTPTPF